jgi:hypothetical protein
MRHRAHLLPFISARRPSCLLRRLSRLLRRPSRLLRRPSRLLLAAFLHLHVQYTSQHISLPLLLNTYPVASLWNRLPCRFHLLLASSVVLSPLARRPRFRRDTCGPSPLQSAFVVPPPPPSLPPPPARISVQPALLLRCLRRCRIPPGLHTIDRISLAPVLRCHAPHHLQLWRL